MKKKNIKKMVDKRIVDVVTLLLRNYNLPTEKKDIIIKGFKTEIEQNDKNHKEQ